MSFNWINLRSREDAAKDEEDRKKNETGQGENGQDKMAMDEEVSNGGMQKEEEPGGGGTAASPEASQPGTADASASSQPTTPAAAPGQTLGGDSPVTEALSADEIRRRRLARLGGGGDSSPGFPSPHYITFLLIN
jgi:hypothetical protein